MKQRFFMSLIIGIILIGGVLLRMVNLIFFDILAVVIMTLSGLEMAKSIGSKLAPPMTFFVAFFPVLSYGAFLGGSLLQFVGGLSAIFLLLVLLFLVMLFVVLINKKYTMENVTSTMFVLIYPMTLASFLFSLNRMGLSEGLFGATAFGATPVALVFLISCFSDVFALLAGMTFKGPKLAPRISPKKTISGAFGGLFGGVLGAFVAVILAQFHLFGLVPLASDIWTNVLHIAILGVVGSMFTQVGDLAASAVKRSLEIKDYGTLLKSHGGVMDRVDGQIFNAVFVYIYFVVLMLVL